jgi:hypothetical protein
VSLYLTIHLHNVPASRETEYSKWFDGPHQAELQTLRGFRKAERFQLAGAQIMPDIAQPWRFMSIYDCDVPDPEIDLPALAPLIASAREIGLIDDTRQCERVYTYAMYGDWVSGPSHVQDQPFSHTSIILANVTAGMEDEYHSWYDQVHIPEIVNSPGHVAMRRGRYADVQIIPRRFCPGGELVICGQQTDDIGFAIRDFGARARGASVSGIAWAPRSKAGSFARTVHYFQLISGTTRWPGGTAYAGDRSVYKDPPVRDVAS